LEEDGVDEEILELTSVPEEAAPLEPDLNRLLFLGIA
jgi:hypothetical protein